MTTIPPPRLNAHDVRRLQRQAMHCAHGAVAITLFLEERAPDLPLSLKAERLRKTVRDLLEELTIVLKDLESGSYVPLREEREHP